MKLRTAKWLVGGLALSNMAGCSGGTPAAEVVNVRVEPFVNPEGKQFQMIHVDWKNTGDTEIRSVHANMVAYDVQGQIVEDVKDYTIYVAGTSGIAPGQTYNEPSGEGYIVLPDMPSVGPAVRAEVKLSRVQDRSALDNS